MKPIAKTASPQRGARRGTAVALRRRCRRGRRAYPSRPIHLIVNFAPGGTGDIVGRIVANQLSIELNQSVVVENRAGAGGTIGARDVANAPPDGYTLTVAQTPEIAINPYFMKDVGYDPLKDLQPIALAGVVPLALVVPINSPYTTVEQWVACAARRRQPMTFASAGVGTPGHIAGELLKLKLDNKLVHVPYKGAGPALNDVAGGQVDFYFPGYPGAVPLIARRPRQTARGLLGETLADRARDADRRRSNRASRISISRCGPGSSVRAACRSISRPSSMPRSTNDPRTRHQSAAAAERRRGIGAVDRSVQRLRAQGNRQLPRHHRQGGYQAGVRVAAHSRVHFQPLPTYPMLPL